MCRNCSCWDYHDAFHTYRNKSILYEQEIGIDKGALGWGHMHAVMKMFWSLSDIKTYKWNCSKKQISGVTARMRSEYISRLTVLILIVDMEGG